MIITLYGKSLPTVKDSDIFNTEVGKQMMVGDKIKFFERKMNLLATKYDKSNEENQFLMEKKKK